MDEPIVRLQGISKRYRTGREEVHALKHVDLEVRPAEFLAIRGPSGSGKTTLLWIVGGMLRPTEGQVIVAGQDLARMNHRERTRFRAQHIGFIFQMFHLVSYLNVLENVLLAEPKPHDDSRERALHLLKEVGLSARERHLPSELSAGEQQRVAIARALLKDPEVILADEPTGNLDPENAAAVMEILRRFQERGKTVIVVTHGQTVERYADRVVHLRDGEVETGNMQ